MSIYEHKKEIKLKILIIFFSFILIIFLSSYIDGAYEQRIKHEGNKLLLVSSFNFPLLEISGMHLQNDEEQTKLYLIGDRFPIIGQGIWVNSKIVDHKFDDISHEIFNKFSICESENIPICNKYRTLLTSQWEAISSDASGNLFLLHEQLASILVYSQKTKKIKQLINLESFSIQPDINHKKINSNSLGEGFLLLNNGHILIVKEQSKPSIIEFGLKDQPPQGYQPHLSLNHKSDFKLPNQFKTSMVPLKVWNLDPNIGKCDLSELALDKQGSLYILSQQCRWIAKLNNLKIDDLYLPIVKYWNLPKKIKKAEAFVILDDSTFIVAEDSNSKNVENIFILKDHTNDVSK